MKLTNELLFLQGNYSTTEILFVIAAGILIGIFVKVAIIFKQRKRILRLEDEMLANHSRILALEKKVAEYRKEKGISHEYTPQPRKSELKVS